MSAYVQPTVDDFKQYFDRDFPYGSTNSTVKDSDINKAMLNANVNWNDGLYYNQGDYFVNFLLLTAHYLVMNLRASSQGISGSFDWLTNSKSVGSVSEGLSIPQRILDNPEFAWFTKTTYGTQWLMYIIPQLSGQVFGIYGGTHA